MKKILFIIGIICMLISCDIPKGYNPPPPAVKDESNENIKDVIYTVNTLVGRDGNTVTGYIYVIDNETIIINNEGGIIKY